ncbi:MAG TPA: BrnA antitoxin family protein [Methylorubrum populi]|uniref:BrnA antitoxin family protein n=1 Tax=Methylorubrum populi TaxID=223967 RepID=A0A921JDL9_9HYPH|nr:BrnA antitoxin family protein [Methylorubrum populi]
MAIDRTRRPSDPRQAAEAAFRAVTRKTPEAAPAAAAAPKAALVPGVRETISLRLDKAVLEHFQQDGPGWQDRINAALKAAAGL